MSDEEDEQMRRDALSMSIVGTKGLLNPSGENNCFLNSAVQVLWHLDAFRQNFRLLSEHACSAPSCTFCALKVIFTQFEFSDESSLPPLALRVALAETFKEQQRFQLRNMDDAAECFENLLSMLHNHVAYEQSEDACTLPHCLTHQMFSMNVEERLTCDCGTSSKSKTYSQLVYYVTTHSVISQTSVDATRGFGHRLRLAVSNGELVRPCPSKCGDQAGMVRVLLNAPCVVSIGLTWDSERPNVQHIRNFVKCIGTRIQLNELFDNVMAGDLELKLVGVVCYYFKHYSTFFYHSKRKTWISFDDACVSEIGAEWEKVVEKIGRGRYQPLLLLYQREHVSLIDPRTAPKQTFVVRNIVSPPTASDRASHDTNASMNNNSDVSSTTLSHQRHSAASKDRSVVTASADLTQNSNNNCSRVCSQLSVASSGLSAPSATGARAMSAAHGSMMNGHTQPLSRATASWLPPPLMPYPHISSTSSTVCSSASSYANQRLVTTAKPFLAIPAVHATCPNHLPVRLIPHRHPNAIQQPSGYEGQFCRPVGSQLGFNPRHIAHNGNGSQQMPLPVGIFQPCVVPACPQQNGQPLVQTFMSSAPSGFIPRPIIQYGGSDTPFMPAVSTAVTATVQPGLVRNGLPPLASPDVCMSLSGMVLNDDDLSLLQDAMKEEQAALAVGRNTLAAEYCSDSDVRTSVSPHVETYSAESDCSLSDWSIIDLPSPPTVSSVTGRDVIQVNDVAEMSVTNLASPSLIHFSPDSTLSQTDANGGPLPGRQGQFPVQNLSTARTPLPGLSTSAVGGPCVESQRKADDLMMVCSMKEVTGDLHAALLCCNQAALSYKQCIKILESSANVSSMERDLIYLKCNDAVTCSRRIHSLIQLKYDEARMNNSQQSKNVPLVSSTSSSSCLTQTPSSSSPLSARTAMMKNDNLIQLEESMPSVRQQMLKEQLSNLYRQPARENAIRGSQIHRGSAAGIVTLLQQRGTASASSQTSTRPLSAAQPAAHSH